MSYNKTKWINDQTKLSATNFNHMENGIEEAHILVEEVGLQAQRALHTALEAKEEIENIDLSSKQDVLESGVNIKTINGKSILGEGDLPIEEGESVNYQELTDVSLDDLVDTGIYYITGARDIPTGTSNEGTLKVQKLSDEKVEQEWKSTTNTAQRILVDGSSAGNKFYVNGVEVERPQGEITLTAGNTYELQGNLQGNIIIEGTANNRTKLILKGVNIQSSLVDSIINYIPNNSKLVIELANGTENYLVVDKDEPTGDNDVGVINSNNNLMITGVGYLSIVNGKGHGIKASELIIDGEPHVYLDTNHDAVHGGKLLKISGGYFVVNNANDAFSASAATNNDGKLLIYGGTYNIRACKQSAFEGKSANGIKRILNANITFGAGVNKLFDNSRASSPDYQIKVYQGLNTIINNSGKEYSEVDMATEFGNASITYNGRAIDPVGNIYELEGKTNKKDQGYYLSGDFSNYRIITKGPGNYVNIIANDVYFKDTTLNEAFIQHNLEKRLKVSINENCLVYLEGNNSQGSTDTAFNTISNIQIIGKGDILIRNYNTGINAPDGYVVLKGDGIRNIASCYYGIITSSLRLGEDPDDTAKPDFDGSMSDTAIYLVNNTRDAKINNTYQETYNCQAIATQYHTGISIIGNIIGSGTIITAQTGEIIATTEHPAFTNSAILYASADSHERINVNDYIPLSGVKDEVPSIEPGIMSPWTVYAGDGYSKAEADARYVLKTDYLEKVAELTTQLNKVQTKADLLEDRFAADIYPDYPKITFIIDSEYITNIRVVRGKDSTDAISLFGHSTVVAYNKDGEGYDSGTGDSAQFNMLVDAADGKKPKDNAEKTAGTYNRCEITLVKGTTNTWRIKYTKVKASFSINIVDEDLVQE